MDTLFATSPDDTLIAYECCGAGPALVLVHGGGSSRREWHEAGYISHLQDEFTVIAPDLRGHGESSLPTDPAAYAPEKMCQDILAVVDACGVDNCALWGMSYGGKVSRYLAAQSKRVTRCILIGTPMGPGMLGQLRQDALDFCAHWSPIVRAQCEGTLDLGALSESDQNMLHTFHVPAMLGWVRAMMDWPSVEPTDFRCPTLWLIGSEDPPAITSLKEYEAFLPGSKVRVHIQDGLDHMQTFEAIDQALPIMLAFTRS